MLNPTKAIDVPRLAAPRQDLEILADAFGLDPADLPDYRSPTPAPRRRLTQVIAATSVAFVALLAPRPANLPLMHAPQPQPLLAPSVTPRMVSASPGARARRLSRPAARFAAGSYPSPPAPTRGLLLVAQPGDTLASLFGRVYRGMQPPPFAMVAALNAATPHAGSLLVFPAPPHGWAVR